MPPPVGAQVKVVRNGENGFYLQGIYRGVNGSSYRVETMPPVPGDPQPIALFATSTFNIVPNQNPPAEIYPPGNYPAGGARRTRRTRRTRRARRYSRRR